MNHCPRPLAWGVALALGALSACGGSRAPILGIGDIAELPPMVTGVDGH
jgi:hypothetical protein